MSSYKDLNVYNFSIEFVTEIYEITKKFPSEEKFGLTSQIRRAAVSIPSNIAEGAMRQSTKEFIQFLYISYSSCAEVETQLKISYNLNYINQEKFQDIIENLELISKLLNSLIIKLKTKH